MKMGAEARKTVRTSVVGVVGVVGSSTRGSIKIFVFSRVVYRRFLPATAARLPRLPPLPPLLKQPWRDRDHIFSPSPLRFELPKPLNFKDFLDVQLFLLAMSTNITKEQTRR